jgi:hypothetical protein
MFIKLYFILKILPCYTVKEEPEPHQSFYLEPELHKNDVAPQECFLEQSFLEFFIFTFITNF